MYIFTKNGAPVDVFSSQICKKFPDGFSINNTPDDCFRLLNLSLPKPL